MKPYPILQITESWPGSGVAPLLARLRERYADWPLLLVTVLEPDADPSQFANGRWGLVTDCAAAEPAPDDVRACMDGQPAPVAWLKTLPRGLVEGFLMAQRWLGECPGLIVAGNADPAKIKTNLLIMVTGAAGREWSPWARAVRARVDLTITNIPGASSPLAEVTEAGSYLDWDLCDPAVPDAGFWEWMAGCGTFALASYRLVKPRARSRAREEG